jgi:hypothetical protein
MYYPSRKDTMHLRSRLLELCLFGSFFSLCFCHALSQQVIANIIPGSASVICNVTVGINLGPLYP